MHKNESNGGSDGSRAGLKRVEPNSLEKSRERLAEITVTLVILLIICALSIAPKTSERGPARQDRRPDLIATPNTKARVR